MELSPLEMRGHLVLALEMRAHLVLVSRMLQKLLLGQDASAVRSACYDPELYLGAPRALDLPNANSYFW